jgi:DNA-binding transcriptional MerR regulator
MTAELYGSGNVARMTGVSRSCLLYRIRKGDVPGSSYVVSGRRIFTLKDVRRIQAALAALTALGDRLT